MSVKEDNDYRLRSSKSRSQSEKGSCNKSNAQSQYYYSQIEFEQTIPSLYDKYSQEIDEIHLKHKQFFWTYYLYIFLMLVCIVNTLIERFHFLLYLILIKKNILIIKKSSFVIKKKKMKIRI